MVDDRKYAPTGLKYDDDDAPTGNSIIIAMIYLQVKVWCSKKGVEQEESWLSPCVPVTHCDHLMIMIVVIVFIIMIVMIELILIGHWPVCQWPIVIT